MLPAERWDTEDLVTAFAARHIGRVLRAYRAHPQHWSRYGPRGIPQSTLAGWLGLTQAQVSRIETGTPVKVASGGGLYQVMPVGMFQASHDAPWNEAHDFDLWRAILRELSEELLGESEDYGSDQAPIDYDSWPLNKMLTAARDAGTLRLFWLGLGMDPLTYVTDMLTVAVFDAELFDETFQQMVASNAEGHRVGVEDGTGRSMGIPFTAERVDRLTGSDPMQPAGAALLRLAWRHRQALLGE